MTRINAAAATGLPLSNLSRCVPPTDVEPGISTTFLDPASLPDYYAMLTQGACMEPIIPDGARVWADKTAPINIGDLVFVFLRPEIVATGGLQVRVKRLLMLPSFVKFPWRDHPQSDIQAIARFGMENPKSTLALRCSDILGIHKCMGLVPPEMAIYRDGNPSIAYGQEPRKAAPAPKSRAKRREVAHG
jgi:hypothetical protein